MTDLLDYRQEQIIAQSMPGVGPEVIAEQTALWHACTSQTKVPQPDHASTSDSSFQQPPQPTSDQTSDEATSALLPQ